MASSQVEMNDLIVEVKLDDDVRYKGMIEDFTKEAVMVSFESSELEPRSVHYDQVFVMPTTQESSDSATTEKVQFEPGQECEIYSSRNQENGVKGWHPVVIKMVRGAFYMFTYTKGDQTADVSEAENFRPRSDLAPLKPDSLNKLAASVVSQLFDCVSDMSNHMELKKHLSPAKISFDNETKELTVITTSIAMFLRAKMMMDLHLKFLDTKANLIRRTKQAQQQLEGINLPRDPKKEFNAKHVEEFSVKENLMGLAIGSSGHNITKARGIEGILFIDVDDNKIFHIYAENKRAAEEARRLLEFDERTIRIPRKKIARVIGRNGGTMQEMVDRSGVLRVKIEGDGERNEDEEKDHVPIVLTGTVESISNMSVIVNYYLMHIEDIDHMMAETRLHGNEMTNSAHAATAAPSS